MPLVHCNALPLALQEGMTNADGDAAEPSTLARTVSAATDARSAVVTSPVAVSAPVMVGLAIDGDTEKTTDPVPVEFVVPVPPLEGASGVCNVMLLKVGEG